MLTAPVTETPLVLPTVPIVKASLSTKVKPLTPLAAKVPMALLVLLSRVTLPPSNNKLDATT